METKFTPGPWVLRPAEVDKPYLRIRGGRLGSKYKIANVHVVDALDEFTTYKKEAKANAHLIAAAPDLYAALEHLLNDSMFKDHPHASQKAIDALAKARGEQ